MYYIYKLENTQTGHFYIGVTKRLSTRLRAHLKTPHSDLIRQHMAATPNVVTITELRRCETEADALNLELAAISDTITNELCLNKQLQPYPAERAKPKRDSAKDSDRLVKGHKLWREQNPELSKQIAIANGSVEAMTQWRHDNAEQFSQMMRETNHKYWSEITPERQQERSTVNKAAQQARVPNILVYTTGGVFINEFPSIRETARVLGLHRNAITAVLKGRSQSTKGYLLRYKT